LNKLQHKGVTVMECPICYSGETHFLFNRKCISPALADEYPIWKCRKCDHVYLARHFSQEELTKLYTQYYPRTNFDPARYEAYKECHGFLSWLDGDKTSAFRYVPQHVRVLDIGCGSCETLGYHQKRGCEVFGVETDQNVKLIAEQNHFNVHIGHFDPAVFEPNSFDYITMNHVMEHLQDPLTTLKGIASLLKSSHAKIGAGGQFITSFPNFGSTFRLLTGRKWCGWHIPFHLQFYSRRSLRILAEQADMKIKSIATITASKLFVSQLGLLVLSEEQTEKYLFHSFQMNTSIKKDWKTITHHLLIKSRCFAPIMRLLDTVGVGHCFVVVMERNN
jgi:SAM-dependent methyltransferase